MLSRISGVDPRVDDGKYLVVVVLRGECLAESKPRKSRQRGVAMSRGTQDRKNDDVCQVCFSLDEICGGVRMRWVDAGCLLADQPPQYWGALGLFRVLIHVG
jgi:hypothetical protein